MSGVLRQAEMLQEGQRFCLKWNNYHSSLTSLLDTLRARHELVDVTLCCQGRQLRAHRLVLSACSPYFREVLKVRLQGTPAGGAGAPPILEKCVCVWCRFDGTGSLWCCIDALGAVMAYVTIRNDFS